MEHRTHFVRQCVYAIGAHVGRHTIAHVTSTRGAQDPPTGQRHGNSARLITGRLMRRYRTGATALLVALITLGIPAPALAVQSHGGGEGYASHQIGHLLFLFGALFMVLRVARRGVPETGRREFTIFLWLIAFWNAIASVAHWLLLSVDESQFVRVNGRTIAFEVQNGWDVFFYAAQMDHLWLVPGLVFLILALRKWSRHL